MTTKDKKKVTKPADPKPETKPADPKPETKPADPKPETKPADPKPETKPADPKPETKPADPKPETKPADPKPDPEPETEPEPEKESEKLDALLKRVEEFSEREAKFNNTIFPVVNSVNVKSWWILGLSVLTIIIFLFLFNFISEKLSENTEIVVSSISKNLDESKDEIKGLVKSLKEGQVKEMEEMKSKFSGMEKTVNNIEAWAIDTGKIVEKHEGRFIKMSKDVNFLKKKKIEEIKKAEEEAKKDLEIENPPAVDLPNPVEEKEEPKPEGTEDGGKTNSLTETGKVGVTMPEKVDRVVKNTITLQPLSSK